MSIPAIPGNAKAGMAHSDCGWTCGCAGKTENPLTTRAIPERFCGGDSLRRGAIYASLLFLLYGRDFSQMPFLTSPVTHMRTSGAWTQICWVKIQRLNQWATGAAYIHNIQRMKKRSEKTQTLSAGCSKAEPKIFSPPPQTPSRERETAKI